MNQIYASGGKIQEGFWDNVQMPDSVRAAYGSNLKKLTKHMNGVADAGGDAKASLEDLNRIIIQNGEAAVQDTTLTQKLIGGLKSVGSTALSMAGNMALNFVVSKGLEWVIGGISDWVNRDQIAIDNGKKSQQTISDTFNEFSKGKTTLNTLGQSFASTNQQITSTGDAIQSVATKYTELSKGVDKKTNANIGLSDEDYQTYLDISSQLATLYPQLQSGTDAQGNAMLNLGTNAKNAAKSIQDLYSSSMLSANVKIGDELQQAFKGVSTQVDKYQKQVDEYDEKAKEYRKKSSSAYDFVLTDSKLNDFIENQSIHLDSRELGDKYGDYMDRISDIFDKNKISYDIISSDPSLTDKNGNPYSTSDLYISDPDVTKEQLQQVGKEIASFSDDLSNKFSAKASEMESKSASTTALIQDQWKGMTDSLGQYLQTTDSFDKLDSNLKTNLLKNLKNLDIESLSKEYDGDALQFMYDKFIMPLSNLSKDQQQAISDVLNIDEAKSTASKYANQVNSAFEKIFPNDKKLQDQWKKNFGLQDIIDDNNNQIETLSNKFKDAKSKITKLDLGTLTNGDRDIAYNLVIDDGEAFNTFDELQKRIAETKQTLSEKDLSLDAMKQVVADTTANLSTLQSATSEASSATGLTADTITSMGGMFSDIDNFDSAALFKNTASGVKLNTKALSSLLAVQHDIKANDFTRSIEEQTKAIAEQNDVVQAQTKGTDAYKTEQDKLKSMFADLSALQQAQSQYHALYKQQQELFSDYGQWQQAQSTANAGDKYNNMVSGLKTAKEAWDKGLIGTDDFKSFAKLISPSGATDDVNFAENYAKAARYLTEDESGVKAFLNDLSSKGLADFNEESQQWSYNVKDMAEAAKQMGMGKDFMSNMFGRLEDYGFHNNVISDAEDGVLKLSDAYSNLAESEARLEDLKKNDPTNTTAIEQAEKEVSGYKQDIDELGTNLKEVASHTAENYNRELETAKNQMKTLADERERILKSNEYGDNTQAVADYMQSQIDQLGQNYGLDSSALQQQAEQAAKAYSDALQNATIENPVTPDFGEDTASADAYASAVDKVQQANKDNNQTLSDSIKTLQQYNSEQIKGIDLLDGAYDSDELKPAEQALDNICQSLGLTSEEAGLLGQVLESMGIIKPEVDDSEVKQAKTDAEETKQTYDNLGDSTVSINADVSGEDSVASFVDQCSSIQQGMTTTITATVSGESEVESLESGLEQIPDNTPTTVDVTVNNQQDLDNIQSKVDSLNAGGKNITLNAHIKPDSDSEVEVKAKDTTVKVTPDPKEVEVTAKPVKVDVQPSQKEVSVSAKVTNKPNATSQGIINYKKGTVEKADGTTSQGIINYKKGDVEKADGTVSTGIINYNLGNVATPTGMVATGVINYTLGSVAKPGKAAGTFGQSRAYAQGSLTDLSAYAGGHVSLPRDEKALVNEVGTESIVRDGQWSLIPGGAHLENLKKGDIIFSASQTEDLLKRGATPGHARAYAQGSLSDISLTHAFDGGSGWGGFGGGLSNKTSVSSSGGSSSQQSYNANSGAVARNTDETEKNTKAKSDSTETFNWVETKLKKFSEAVEHISNQITDYISSAFKTVLLKRQVKAVEKQLKANEQGYTAYMNKANSIDISDDYKNKVINGTFSIEEIDTSSDSGKQLAKDIKSFQTYYNSAQDCKDTVQELNNKLLELYETIVNMPTEKAEKKIDRLKTKLESLNAVSDTVSLGGSAIKAMQNQIKVDIPGLGNAQKKLDKAETARNATKKTRAKASKTLKSATVDAESTGNTLIKTSEKQTKSIGKKLKNAAKSSANKATYNAIAQAVREGKAVNTKGLKGSALKYAKSYNSSLKQGNTIASKVKAGKTVKTSEMSNILKSTAQAYNTDAKEKASAQKVYDNAKKADEKALNDLTKAQKNKDKLYSGSTKEQQILATTKGKKSYVYQNMLLTQETKNLKEQNKHRQKALKETRDSYMKAKSKYDTADADKTKSQNKILNNKSAMSKLNKTQQKALKAGKTVSTKGITDPKVLKWIQDYNEKVKKSADLSKKLRIEQEALDKATSEAAQSQAEYAQSIVENAKKKLENIANYYDSFTSQWENRNSMYEAYMDRMQTQGYNLSTKFYEAEIGQQQKIVDNLSQKYIAMKRNFAQAVQDGTIVEGTEEYYEMQNEIDQVALSLKEAQNKVVEFQASIRDLKWEQFDQLQDAIGRITSESDFLIDLMSHKDMYDKDGNMTEQGLATMGLHGVNYNTYMAQADKYKEEMLKISEELANDPNNQKLIDRKNELIDAQQQAILSAEDEKDSIKDLIQDGIDKQLDALDDLIDKYLDCLDSEKSLYEYRKKIGEQSEKIASLQKQLSSLQGDNSEENKAKLQKLKEDLKSAQDDMEETQYDKYISDQKKLLDELKQDYKKALDDRMDNVDVLISDAIASINSNSSNISQTLQTESKNVGYTLSGEMQTIWTSQSGIISQYGDDFSSKLTGVNSAIENVYNRQKDMIDAINAMAEKWIAKADQMLQQPTKTEGVLEEVEQKPDKDNVAEGNPTPDPPKVSDKDSIKDAVLVDPDEPKKKPNKTNETKTGNGKAEVGDKVTFSSGRYYEASDGSGASGNMYLGKKVKITRINKGSKYPYAIDATDGTELGWVKLNQLKGYASGIMRVPNDQLAWTQEQDEEAIVRNDGSILTPLSRDVSVLNADMTKNLWDFMGNPGSFLSDYSDGEKFGVKNVDNSSSVDVGGVTIQCNMPNVQNANDLLHELTTNKDIEKAICAMTIGRAMSGSSLAKYKYKK
jgi:DNA repair exonuclease SbcCD ATPase subunit|nr:MAG TPA: ATPase [Caudoviricetes sp.]